MDNISNLKATICALIGAMGGLIVKLLFGGWSEDMATLIIFIYGGRFYNGTRPRRGFSKQ